MNVIVASIAAYGLVLGSSDIGRSTGLIRIARCEAAGVRPSSKEAGKRQTRCLWSLST